MLPIVFALIVTAEPPGSTMTILGIWEEVAQEWNTKPRALARVLFAHDSAGWRAFPHRPKDQEALAAIIADFPTRQTWTACLAGKAVGHLNTRRPPSFEFYSQVGVQTIAGDLGFSIPANADNQFSGWVGAPLHHPIVLNSRSNCAHPAMWKTIVPDAELARDAIAKWRALVAKHSRSMFAPDFQDKGDPNLPASVRRTLMAADGRKLLTLNVMSGELSFGVTILLDLHGSASLVGGNLELVDSGDYVADGNIELIFKESNDNRDGYAIVNSDFSAGWDFDWNFH